MNTKIFTTKILDVEIKATVNDLAENANGSVLIEAENTVVFITATMSKHETNQDYFPLSVEFEERFYSAGAILGSRFIRREGRPSQEAVLNARIIDRTIRPFFPKGFYREVQVIPTVISFGKYNPDVLAIIGASIALGISDIPWNGPVSAIRFAKAENTWKPFTHFNESKNLIDELLLCGKDDIITMIEMEGKEIQEEEIIKTSIEGQKIIEEIQTFQKDIISQAGKEKIPFEKTIISENIKKLFEKDIKPALQSSLFNQAQNTSDIRNQWNDIVNIHAENNSDRRACADYIEDIIDDIIHTEAINNKKRSDGRKLDEVRPLFAQAGGVSKILHGSGIFYRGGTHVFTALTLGGPGDALLLNTVENPEKDERFMHHYNFPPFSTGETGRVGSPKRRELGHGALAEKALRPMLPPASKFPYTIRLVSECFSSNGSTSMASTCASTIALMDGGVPIEEPVAGIAIGLMQKNNSYVLLTDIQGPEDHHGDMDFKAAGTKNGINAIQMDVKVEGITQEILKEALQKAKEARITILKTITNAIPSVRESLLENAPHIKTITINPDSIGMVIGSGGKTIKGIRADTGAQDINIEDDGTITISGSKESVASAYDAIYLMTRELEVGDVIDAKIKNITEFGAFAEITPGKDGLIHISEFSPEHINNVEDIVSVGDIIPVIIQEVRDDGKISLSVKARDPEYFKNNNKIL